MPSKRRNVKRKSVTNAPPSAAAAVTQAALAAQAAAAAADTAVKTATAAVAPTASAVSDAAAAVQSAIAAYQTVAAALAALHDSLAVSTAPAPLAAPSQPSAAVVVTPPPLLELLPGQSWWDWMPPTVRRRLLALAGIDPDASRWDTLPMELRLMILSFASPLTRFLCHQLKTKQEYDAYPYDELDLFDGIWVDALTVDWPGDLGLLPNHYLKAGTTDSPGFLMASSRSMYHRLCAHFPGQADADYDHELCSAINSYAISKSSNLDRLDWRLFQIPMRRGWFDLVDMTFPIALGWIAIYCGHPALLRHLVAHHRVRLKRYRNCGDLSALGTAASQGHVDIMQMLYDAGNTACSTAAMDLAAALGHLDAVVWLHTHGYHCTTFAMDRAMGGGHLDVVKWLHLNRTEGYTQFGVDQANHYCRPFIIEWLNAHPRHP